MRGMCCSDGEKLLADFLEYLETRDLSICNFTKTSMIFWPTDARKVADRFLVEMTRN